MKTSSLTPDSQSNHPNHNHNFIMNLKEAVEFCFAKRNAWKYGDSEQTNRINCNHCLRLLGEDMDVADITALTFVELQGRLKEETVPGGEFRSNGGVNRITQALSTVLGNCAKFDIIKSKPKYERLPEKKNARTGYYSEDEVKLLLEAALKLEENGQMLHDSILFAYFTGNRQGELLKLKYTEVDFDMEEITFLNTKNGEDHTIPMNPALRSMLERRVHDRICERIFPWEGYRLGKGSLLSSFYKAKKLAGLTCNRDWHCIRHTTGTHLISSGVPIRAVMGVLNHKNIETTLRYAKNTNKAIKNAVDALDLGLI